MTTTIKKLTPPQLAALREAFPGLVGAGILSMTRSTATFDLGEHEPEHPNLKGWEPTPEALEKLLFGAGLAGKLDQQRALPIIKKLQTGKDVVETAERGGVEYLIDRGNETARRAGVRSLTPAVA